MLDTELFHDCVHWKWLYVGMCVCFFFFDCSNKNIYRSMYLVRCCCLNFYDKSSAKRCWPKNSFSNKWNLRGQQTAELKTYVNRTYERWKRIIEFKLYLDALTWCCWCFLFNRNDTKLTVLILFQFCVKRSVTRWQVPWWWKNINTWTTDCMSVLCTK